MTSRRLSTLAVAVAAACCSLPLVSAATAPLGSPPPATTPPHAPVLGFAALLPDRANTVAGRFLADGSRLTMATVDASGTEWRVTLEAGALSYPLEVHLTPLVRAAVWGSPLRPAGGILIEPSAELAIPAEVTAGGLGGAGAVPSLLADDDGRDLRLAPHSESSPQIVELSRLGAVLTADVPPGVLAADRAAVLGTAAALLRTPVPQAVTPPDLPSGCPSTAAAGVLRTLTDPLVVADVDPERTVVEQVVASADALGTPRLADAALASALAGRVAERLTASIDVDRTGPARGAARFDAAATAAESIQSVLGLFPTTARRPPSPSVPRPSPTPGVERTTTDPMSVLAAAMASWAGDLTVADADALAADHDYGAPARVAARQRLVEQLGVQLPADALSRLLAAERYHVVLDVTVSSRPGPSTALAVHTRVEADLAAGQGAAGSAIGSDGGIGVRVGTLLPCASPPAALIGADSYGAVVAAGGAGRPETVSVDAAVRSAFVRQLAGTGLLTFPLLDGASPAVDATITGSGVVPGLRAPVDVAVHALLLHAPAAG